VVARGHDHRGPRAEQPADDPVEHGRRVRGGHRPVVDVAGDQHHVDRLLGDHARQPREHRLLLGQQLGAVQRPAEVPVRGVQEAHGRKVGVATDRTGSGAP
jgi:hypothetical protein